MLKEYGFLQAIKFLPSHINNILNSIDIKKIAVAEEIRLRINRNIIVNTDCEEIIINYKINRGDLEHIMSLLCNYSLYSYEEEIKAGYITIEGGHRVGICGETISINGAIESIINISFINIRIAHEIKDAAKKALPYIISSDGQIRNTLIISPPQCGKTTMLRDIAVNISDGNLGAKLVGRTVTIIDERSEIAACIRGEPSNYVGGRTDVLDKCDKANGIILAIRSMSPRVIIVDEIGKKADAVAIADASNAGINIITSIHGNSIDDFWQRDSFRELERGIFDRYIILSRRLGAGTVESVLDKWGQDIK